ncbi:MAG TPA: hypothetical protein VMU89_16380 [Thermomicrobiaceae bacterium]|nr:hypothetical protein [Thermomicrobiaceae bacterium]
MKLFGSSTSTRDGSAAGGTQTGQGRRGEPAGSRRNRLRRLIVATAVTGAVTGVVFALVLPTFASYGPVWRVAQSLSWSWLAALAAAALLNVATFPLPWIVALPGLGFLNALRMTQASTAFSLVVPGGAPIGMAASFGMLRSWRLAGRPVAVAVALTGIWNQLTTFAFPMVGVALLALTGVASGRLKVLAISGLVAVVTVTTLLALALAKPRVAFAVGELSMRYLGWLRRGRRAAPPTWGGGSAVLLRTETVALLRQRWARRDGLRWPHRDGLKWPHLPSGFLSFD